MDDENDDDAIRQRVVPARTVEPLTTTGQSSVFDVPGHRTPVIEIDIPVAKVWRGDGGRYGPALARMEIGDSFSAPRSDLEVVRSATRRRRERTGDRFVIRTVSENTLRVWRTA